MTAINKEEINKIVLETIRDYSSDTVYFKDLDSGQIAEALGVSPGNARVILSRGLDRLEELLADWK